MATLATVQCGAASPCRHDGLVPTVFLRISLRAGAIKRGTIRGSLASTTQATVKQDVLMIISATEPRILR